jgi:hypothetical protein
MQKEDKCFMYIRHDVVCDVAYYMRIIGTSVL